MPSYPPELWTWENCKAPIKSLPGRLGFPVGKKLKLLGYELDLDTGLINDNLASNELDMTQRNGRFAGNAIFYVLSAYSNSIEKQPTGKLISSKQFRGTKFTERDTMGERYRVARYYKDTESLENAVKRLNGSRVEFPYGDIAVSFKTLPYIPLTIVLTLENREFPADVRLFYDETIENYLDSEQTYFLTSLSISRIIQISLFECSCKKP
jgi:hypothetical protein